MMSTEGDSTQRMQRLLERGVAGSLGAYSALLTQASERLLRLTRKMLRGYPHLRRWEQTDDVFQSATLRLYRSLSTVRPESPAAFWGLAATQIRRTLIDLARHHYGPAGAGKHHHSGAGTSEDGSPQEGLADPHGLEPATLQEWTEFHEAVEQLPSAEREVFQLLWYTGLPQKEVAQTLQISLPTVQRRWYSAQLLLHDRLHGRTDGDQEP